MRIAIVSTDPRGLLADSDAPCFAFASRSAAERHIADARRMAEFAGVSMPPLHIVEMEAEAGGHVRDTKPKEAMSRDEMEGVLTRAAREGLTVRIKWADGARLKSGIGDRPNWQHTTGVPRRADTRWDLRDDEGRESWWFTTGPSRPSLPGIKHVEIVE